MSTSGTILSGSALKVRDEILSLRFLLETGKNHLGARNVLLRVLEVLEKGVLAPDDTFVDIGLGI